MSDNKKYYYLKLKDGFFSSDEMKILSSQKNGAEYQLLYMKLTLLSVKSEGRLEFRHGVPYDAEMLSSVLDVGIDTVKAGIELFAKLRLVEMLETGVIFMSDIQNMIGHGSSEAERKAAYRLRIEGERDNVPRLSQKRPPEIEIESERERETESECMSSAKADGAQVTEKKADVLATWNNGIRQPVPKVMDISPERWKRYKARVSEGMDLATIVKLIDGSDFLSGRTDRGTWTATFDWIVKSPTNWRKVMEGHYTNRKQGSARATAKSGSNTDAHIKRLEEQAAKRAETPLEVPEGF